MQKISQKRLAIEVILDMHKQLALMSKRDRRVRCGELGWHGVKLYIFAGQDIIIPAGADYPKAAWLRGAAKAVYNHCRRMGLQPRLSPQYDLESFASDTKVARWKFAGYYNIVLEKIDHYSFARCWAERRRK